MRPPFPLRWHMERRPAHSPCMLKTIPLPGSRADPGNDDTIRHRLLRHGCAAPRPHDALHAWHSPSRHNYSSRVGKAVQEFIAFRYPFEAAERINRSDRLMGIDQPVPAKLTGSPVWMALIAPAQRRTQESIAVAVPSFAASMAAEPEPSGSSPGTGPPGADTRRAPRGTHSVRWRPR